MYILDKKDKAILNELQIDSKKSTRELGRKLRIPATTIHQRIKRLIDRGIIARFSVVIDPEKVELPTTAIVFIKRASTKKGKVKSENIGETLAKLPEAEEVYLITGEHDVAIKVRGKSEREIGKWVVDTLWNMPEVDRTLTFFVFHKSKESNMLSIK